MNFVLFSAISTLFVAIGVYADEPLILSEVLVLNRHGHRAPNAPYWSMCPNDAYNKKKYDVLPEDLSGLGMEEEFQFGKYLRQRYNGFVSPVYNRDETFIRAVGVSRCVQSAMAIGQGLYPDGFGPGGWLPGRPQYVPIFSDIDDHEYLIDNSMCWTKSLDDQTRWYKTHFDEYMADPITKAAIDEVIELCGATRPVDNGKMALFVKIVVDGIIFNSDYGLSVLGGKVTPSLMAELRNISIRFLLGRLETTQEQKTYMAMEFPHQLLMLANQRKDPRNYKSTLHPVQKMQIYVGHREELYGLAEYLGFQVNVKGLAPSELPVAATYIFEIFRQWNPVRNLNDTFVKTTLWTLQTGEYSIAIPGCESPRLCKEEELAKIIKKRESRTGSWREICGVKDDE